MMKKIIHHAYGSFTVKLGAYTLGQFHSVFVHVCNALRAKAGGEVLPPQITVAKSVKRAFGLTRGIQLQHNPLSEHGAAFVLNFMLKPGDFAAEVVIPEDAGDADITPEKVCTAFLERMKIDIADLYACGDMPRKHYNQYRTLDPEVIDRNTARLKAAYRGRDAEGVPIYEFPPEK